MEKFDDRLDGFTVAEYDALAQAYNVNSGKQSNNGILVENKSFFDSAQNESKIFGGDDFVATLPTQESNVTKQNDVVNYDDNVVAPAPQISYSGLNDNERKYLNDLIQDLRQYYNDDYGLSQYLGQEVQEVERPILYFVSKNKILSKIVNLLCSIFDKSRLNKELSELVNSLISLSRIVNAK